MRFSPKSVRKSASSNKTSLDEAKYKIYNNTIQKTKNALRQQSVSVEYGIVLRKCFGKYGTSYCSLYQKLTFYTQCKVACV